MDPIFLFNEAWAGLPPKRQGREIFLIIHQNKIIIHPFLGVIDRPSHEAFMNLSANEIDFIKRLARELVLWQKEELITPAQREHPHARKLPGGTMELPFEIYPNQKAKILTQTSYCTKIVL